MNTYIWIQTCTHNLYKFMNYLQNYIYILNNLTHTHIYINYELEHYEIKYIMQYEMIWKYEWNYMNYITRKKNYSYEYEIA